MFGLIGTEDDGFVTVDLAGFAQEEPLGASPAQALRAIRDEKAAESTFTAKELSRLRAENEESGYASGGGFCSAPPSRTPFRMFADFVGADPRFREPVMSGSDGAFTAVGGEMLPATVGYPDGNPKTEAGAKKPDLSVVPPVSLLHLATAMMNGAEKYGPFNWRDQPISYRPYLAAAMRHLMACLDGEDFSADTVEAELPVHHLGHVMACCAIVLDAIHCGTMNDNRPAVAGDTGPAIELYNRGKRLLQA